MKRAFLVIAIICALSGLAAAQTTAFNFQGRLNDGSNPANGRYDLQFKLSDVIAGGNQVGAIVSRPNTMLINGVFSTTLDFGAAAFAGGDRFLEIQVRPAGSANAYVILGARQQIMSVPYSVKSLNAANADNAQTAVNAQNATNAQNAVNATNATNAANATTAQTAVNSQQLGSLPANRYLATDANGNVNLASANLTQSLSANGLPKGFLRLDRDGNITYCYNAVTGASTGNCGFGVTHLLGQYRVSFGFNVSNRVINLTTEFDGGHTVAVINQRNSSDILIYVFYSDSGSTAFTNSPVNIVVF